MANYSDHGVFEGARSRLNVLDGQTPLSVLETDPERIADLLRKIADG